MPGSLRRLLDAAMAPPGKPHRSTDPPGFQPPPNLVEFYGEWNSLTVANQWKVVRYGKALLKKQLEGKA